jgi:uncharacterized protein involved in exopolysaccharide biosynthesis
MRLPNRNRITLRDLLTMAFYDRKHIAVGAAFPFLLGLLAALLATPWYESDASLLVLNGNDYFAKSSVNATVTSLGLQPKQILSAEAELIDNRNLMLDVLKQVGPARIYPGANPQDTERQLERLRADLQIEPVFSAGVLRLSLRNRDPGLAAETLARIVADYIEKRDQAVGDRKTASMAEQADQMSAKLKEAETALNRFSVEQGIYDMKGQRDQLLRMRSELSAQQAAVQALIASRRSEAAANMAQLRSIPPSLQASNSNGRVRELENAKASLLTLELRRKDLVTRLSEDSEEVKNVDLQISTVRSFLSTEPALIHDTSRETRNPAYDLAQRRLATLDAEIQGLEVNAAQATKDIAAITDRLSALDSQAPTYDRLAEAEHTAEETMLTYLPKLEELKINEELAQRLSSDVRIIQAATLPTIRHSNSRLYLFFGFLGAPIGGLAAAFFRTSLRQVCVVPSEMEQWLNLQPVLVISHKDIGTVK